MTAINLPRMRYDQYEIIQHPAKVKCLAMGRRWGKTVVGGTVGIAAAAMAGSRVAWVVPTYKNGRPIWRFVESTLAPLVKAKRASVNKAERLVEFTNGGSIGIYSADNPVSMLGENFGLVVIDEAARIDGNVWYETLMPTLADNDGDAILISTPKGKNWFYHEFVRGLGDGVTQMSWNAPTNANPMPTIQAAYAKAREVISERTFQQEWDARFLDDGGLVFRYVREAASGAALDAGEPGKRYVIGVDLGKAEDYTVYTVIDAAEKRVVRWERFNHVDYSTTGLERLRALVERFNGAYVWVETNNVGQMFIELLRGGGIAFSPFTTTNDSKRAIIDALTVAFERREITLPHDDRHTESAIAEFEAFELETLPSGRLKFGAPSGMHDDMVMSTAIGWHAIAKRQPLFETEII